MKHMTGYGKSFGAITVVNAMPCGIGATIGTTMETTAVFSADENDIAPSVIIGSDPLEDDLMARLCVESAYERAGVSLPAGWKLTIGSDIPISRGLKSSSSACNAVLSAVFDHLGFEAAPLDLIKIGVDCARRAGVTVTGAFDDACGCHLGGFVLTDNTKDEILFEDPNFGIFDVILCVPEKKIRKKTLPLDALRKKGSDAAQIAEIARTDPFDAMVRNGALIAGVLGEDNSLADKAMSLGALGAGMTGAGPAVAIVVEKGTARSFLDGFDAPDVEIRVTQTRSGRGSFS